MASWVVIGAGLTGASFARSMANSGHSVTVLDRRDHIAGNAFDGPRGGDRLCHWYGPHIFHTNAVAVWNFLSQFTDWIEYEHRVVALVDGRLVPVPFNFTSLKFLLGEGKASDLIAKLTSTFQLDEHVPILELMRHEDREIQELAQNVYRWIFEGYTLKQWGVSPTELSPSVTARVPIRMGWDDRYFRDRFQFVPKAGYEAMVSRMLDSPNIRVELEAGVSTIREINHLGNVFFTGPVDELLGFRLGALPYRSLRFEYEHVKQPRHLPVAQLNFPNDHDFTRITEVSHITQEFFPDSLIITEFPETFQPGFNEPYYPVPHEPNRNLYRKYARMWSDVAPRALLGGRLADYKYLNMDQAVARGLSVAKSLGGQASEPGRPSD